MQNSPALTRQPKFSIVGGIALVGLVLVGLQHYSQLRENKQLQQEVGQLARVTAENQRLSNIVAAARITQAEANSQFQELLRLRNEVNRLRQENQASSLTNQVALAQATDQLRQLRALEAEAIRFRQATQEMESLRDELQQLRTAAVAAAQTETTAVAQAEESQDRALSVRMIRTQGDAFAEKLKRTVGAPEGQSFQEVFGRFLRMNGVEPSQLSRVFYDERTGRVIVRADQATLDQIEKLTVALDQSQ